MSPPGTAGAPPVGSPTLGTVHRHRIDTPHPDEAAALADVHLRTWLETYPNADAGIDAAWITEHIGPVTAPPGVARWRAVIADARDRPDRTFCRAVRPVDGDGVAGFLCGLREPAGEGTPGGTRRPTPGSHVVTLGPMYLLPEARDHGVGGRLMTDFLGWTGADPARLWVTSYNEAAVRFYARHGFRPTGERELWHGRLPNLRMARAPRVPAVGPAGAVNRLPGGSGVAEDRGP